MVAMHALGLDENLPRTPLKVGAKAVVQLGENSNPIDPWNGVDVGTCRWARNMDSVPKRNKKQKKERWSLGNKKYTAHRGSCLYTQRTVYGESKLTQSSQVTIEIPPIERRKDEPVSVGPIVF
ncbi:hypothetical protein I7I51_00606 [Histoplasma capsulatum]|uniref:Uncharacterized protein n=1 Tax=Ajellomyces capsulatus TaxID=5037 RepID=A0A8A1MAH6_AJECA|nr:hypothetical protein I7I51_00606 [Histoplasma capsulatum]